MKSEQWKTIDLVLADNHTPKAYHFWLNTTSYFHLLHGRCLSEAPAISLSVTEQKKKPLQAQSYTRSIME